jgi:hypothetical protein
MPHRLEVLGLSVRIEEAGRAGQNLQGNRPSAFRSAPHGELERISWHVTARGADEFPVV